MEVGAMLAEAVVVAAVVAVLVSAPSFLSLVILLQVAQDRWSGFVHTDITIPGGLLGADPISPVRCSSVKPFHPDQVPGNVQLYFCTIF